MWEKSHHLFKLEWICGGGGNRWLTSQWLLSGMGIQTVHPDYSGRHCPGIGHLCVLHWGREAEAVSAPRIAPWCCPTGLEWKQDFSPTSRCSCFLSQLKAKTNLFNQGLSEFLNYKLGRNLIGLIKKVYFMVIQFCYAARLNVSSGGSVCYKYSLPHSDTLSWP